MIDVHCASCDTAPERERHKGDPVLACPDCGDILYRPMTTDDPSQHGEDQIQRETNP